MIVFEIECEYLPLVSYLNTSFGQVDLHGQILTCKNIRIVSLSESVFQFFQLQKRE